MTARSGDAAGGAARPLPPDLASLREGGKAALARTLSAIEAAPWDMRVAVLLDAAYAAPRGTVLGLTGPPGVGKSTLTSTFVAALRARGARVGVLAVDPSSKRSGGALLGDRTRIVTDPRDEAIFVRSVAAGRRLGGLAASTYPASVLMRALFDWVIVETVGVGQSEAEIADCADITAFCAQPGAGDAVQYMKAGILERPDLLLVTKSDLGASAIRTAADARGALSLAVRDASPPVEVALLSAANGEGIVAALDLIAERASTLARSDSLIERRWDQHAAWAAGRIADSFGTETLTLMNARMVRNDSPFASLATLHDALRRALHDCLKNV